MSEGVISLYGTRHLVKGAERQFGDGECSWIRLSRVGWTPCSSSEEAMELMAGFLDVLEEEQGLSRDDVVAGFGLLADNEGRLVGHLGANGTVTEVLGERDPSGALKAVAMSSVSMALDEQNDKEPWEAGSSDYWAMGRVV